MPHSFFYLVNTQKTIENGRSFFWQNLPLPSSQMLGISRHAQISKISGFSVNILKKKHSATEMASAFLQNVVVPFFFSFFLIL